MQNNGLVLSMADVQALRNAGFEPKGTIIKGTPQGFSGGGTVRGYAPGGLETGTEDPFAKFSEITLNNRDSYTVEPFTTITNGVEVVDYRVRQPNGNYLSPQEGGLAQAIRKANIMNKRANTPEVDYSSFLDFSNVDFDALSQNSTGSYSVKPVTNEQGTTAYYQVVSPTGEATGNYTQESLARAFAEADRLNDQNNLNPINYSFTSTAQQETPDPTQPAPTQREDLLGPQGLETYNAAQANLQNLTDIYTQGTTPTQTTATTPISGMYQIPEGDGGAPTPPTFPSTATAQQAAPTQAVTPTKPDLAEAEAVLASDEVKAYLDQVRAAQGEISANNLVTAATQDPNALAQLQLNAAQISQAQQVQPVADRTVQQGELISGPAVEQERVESLVSDIKAATAEPSELATIQGQLAKLTADFDVKNPPAWAAASLRNATAQLAARGLGASSMAGQAIIQATFEAATPIAAADAATVAQFEQMNLSNRQQATMLAAQQRAQFLGQEFDQAFQTKVANASRIAEIANMNFNADVQIALENARLAQSVDIANLNASNAKVLADAAAMSNMDLANLNNRQQAAVANAKAFLDMDMANLNNEQQTAMIKTQQAVNAMLSDQAAENAAINLNTTNENQLNQFFTNLEASVAQFNAAQRNAIAQSNVSEINAMVKFKEEQANNLRISYDRNQTAISTARLSANTSLLSAQIGAESARTTAEISAAASQRAAEIRAATDTAIALAANEAKVTLQEMEQQYQREADIMAMSYDAMVSNSDKAFRLIELDLIGDINLEAAQFQLDAAEDKSFKDALADIAIDFGGELIDKII